MDGGWTKDPEGYCWSRKLAECPFVVVRVVVWAVAIPSPNAGAGGQATRLCGAHLIIFNYTKKLVALTRETGPYYLPNNQPDIHSLKTHREACSEPEMH